MVWYTWYKQYQNVVGTQCFLLDVSVFSAVHVCVRVFAICVSVFYFVSVFCCMWYLSSKEISCPFHAFFVHVNFRGLFVYTVQTALFLDLPGRGLAEYQQELKPNIKHNN